MSKSGHSSFRSLMRPWSRSNNQLVVFKFRSLKQQTLPFFPVIFALSSHRAAISRAGARMKHYYKSLSFWSRIIQTVPPLFPKSPICSIKSTFTHSLSLSLSLSLSVFLQHHLIFSRQNVKIYLSHSPQLPSCLGLSGQIKVPRRWCGVVWCGVWVFLLISVGTWS